MTGRKKPIYPIEEWTVTETSFDRRTNYRNETTFSLSNGYIGTRGTFEEAYDFDIDTGLEGNFVNGFYESEKIRYGEANFGSPLQSQSLLNLPNLKETKLYVDGEEFHMERGKVTEYSRVLHMREGFLERSLVWTSPGGKSVGIRIERLVSFEMEHIMAVRYEVTPLNFSGQVRFVSKLQGDVENHTRKTNPIVDYGPFGRKLDAEKLEREGSLLYYEGTTQMSGLTVGCGSSHRMMAGGKPVIQSEGDPAAVGYPGGESAGGEKKRECTTRGGVSGLCASCSLEIEVSERETAALEKMICYGTSLEMEKEKLQPFVKEELRRAEETGFENLKRCQEAHLEKFWDLADIRIEGEESGALMQGMRFNLFHIFQSAARGGRQGMGAKGLSGEGYEGHYFWDTEMYALPVFIYTAPETARRLLDFRYGTLKQARERAGILGHEKGALFPWRTINGEEASTYYPLGTAQYHINADIAYALSLYLQVTGDREYFKEKGAELLLETARIWADVGSFAACRGGRYCICCVTGPDEYNVLVDNNFYTNLMAREHLRDAAGAVRWLMEEEPETYRGLKEKLDFREEELALWDEIVEKMYFPYDEERKIYPMDDGFLMRKPWDETKIPEEKRSWLYENYHPLFIMRQRMSKQADAVLGLYLHSNLFTKEEIRRNYDFYQEVTLHHSSLSTCIFGIVACGIGRVEDGYGYFMQSARMDLDDYHNNFYAGIHAANMAGTWQAVVNGFGGMRCQGGELRFEPVLPKKWEKYSFRVRYQGSVLEVSVTRDRAVFSLLEGRKIGFSVYGKRAELKEGEKAGFRLYEEENRVGNFKRYRAVFFDWDGTAVLSRKAPVDEAVAAMRPLLRRGVKLVIVSGTTIENIAGGRIETYFTEKELDHLYLGLGRGAFNYAFREGAPCVFRNMLPDGECLEKIHRICFEIHMELKKKYDFDTDIVFSRPNYCKIDLMPNVVRGDNLFMQENELELLKRSLAEHGITGGLKGLVELAEKAGEEQGLKVKPTCDAKYLEVGISSKSDNVDVIFGKLQRETGITAAECAFWGDEFVGIEKGIFGSDSFMLTELTEEGDFFDVSEVPGERPEGVVQTGGGVEKFLEFLRRQGE